MKLFSDYIKFNHIEPKPLRTIFTTSKPDELEVLEKMMQLDPKKRPDASEVIDEKKSEIRLICYEIDSSNGIFQ